MAQTLTPLRYPGGKSVLSNFLGSVIEDNDIKHCIYVEPFAGGAGAALNLLFSHKVEQLILNDADPAIYAFWKAILRKPDEFIRLIEVTSIDMANWQEAKKVSTVPKIPIPIWN
ncbi:MAG: DNA adenine methylase [Opitutaceae bacterium]|nr:DNA adenine methylase [Opitutaceae bacterium]